MAGGLPLAGTEIGTAGCPFTSLLLDTVTLSLIVFAPSDSANKRGSWEDIGVCGGVGSALDVVRGELRVCMLEALTLLRRI